VKGRKPVPIELKILRGQRRRSSTEEPVMVASTPQKPKGLDALETAYWNALVKDLSQRRILHESMSGVLEVAVSCYAEWQRAAAACRKSGVYRTKSRKGPTIWKQKPEVAIAHAAKKQFLTVLIELGLTPSSAARCHPLPVEKKQTARRDRQLLRQAVSLSAS
jgi:P27 family predicted phage terminase small subunit